MFPGVVKRPQAGQREAVAALSRSCSCLMSCFEDRQSCLAKRCGAAGVKRPGVSFSRGSGGSDVVAWRSWDQRGEVRGAGWENRMRSEAFLSELRRLRLQNQREAMAAQSQGGLMFVQEYEASAEVLTLAELRARLATLASPSLSVKFFSAKELDEFLTLPEIRGVRTLKIEFQFAHPWLIRYRLRRTEQAAVLGLSHA